MLPPHCYNPRPIEVHGEVIHWISLKNLFDDERQYDPDLIIKFLTEANTHIQFRKDPIYTGPRIYASYHRLITREGEIIDLVPLNRKAWHAGKSRMVRHEFTKEHCNLWCAGTALIGKRGDPFPKVQLDSCAKNSADLITKYGFNYLNIQGHDQVRTMWNAHHHNDQARKKDDPGTFVMIKGEPQFNWHKHHVKVVEYMNA